MFERAQEPVTIASKLRPPAKPTRWQERKQKIIALLTFGKELRKSHDYADYVRRPVMWRNYEASFNVARLAPIAYKIKSFVLEEYFIPVEWFTAGMGKN